MDYQTMLDALNAALAKSKELKTKMVITFVDSGGNLLMQLRQPNAWIGSIDISLNKAYTAVAFSSPGADNGISTQKLAEMAQPGQPLYGIQNTNNGRIVVFAGGIPIYDGDTLLGAVGVSGSTIENDQAVAEAAVAVFKKG